MMGNRSPTCTFVEMSTHVDVILIVLLMFVGLTYCHTYTTCHKCTTVESYCNLQDTDKSEFKLILLIDQRHFSKFSNHVLYNLAAAI